MQPRLENCLASHIHMMRTPHFVVLTSVLFGLHHISCILQEGLAEENNFLTFIQTLADFFHHIFSIVGTGYFEGVPGTWLYGTGYRPQWYWVLGRLVPGTAPLVPWYILPVTIL